MRRWSFVVGAALIILGVFSIFQVALDALGISFRIWWVFWPLVLIGVGLWIVMGFTRRGPSDLPREQSSVPLEGAQTGSVTVHHGAGRLTIGAGAPADQLLSGSFGGGLDASRRVDAGRLSVDMKVRDRVVSHYIFGPWHRGWAGALDWDFNLNPSLPLSLRLETGASESRLSLTDLQVRELHLKTGASSTTIDLPVNAGFTRVIVESGAASVRLRVPTTVAATIRVRSALAGIHVDASRFHRTGGSYASTDYDSAKNKVEIDVETGVGSVEIY